MAKLAAFPKAWLDALEFYAGFLDLRDPSRRAEYRRRVEDQGRSIPMLCCSPDFTHPDPAFRAQQIDQEKRWIELTQQLGGQFCRILSGQRRGHSRVRPLPARENGAARPGEVSPQRSAT